MIALIDTSSLVALVDYYLPFDKNGIILSELGSMLDNGELVVIDRVSKECAVIRGGSIITAIPFLSDKNRLDNIAEHKVDNTFIKGMRAFNHKVLTSFHIKGAKQLFELTEEEFELEREDFKKGADFGLIYVAEALKEGGKDVIVVTQESRATNDRKVFKKVPQLCDIMNTTVTGISDFLISHTAINVNIGSIPNPSTDTSN